MRFMECLLFAVFLTFIHVQGQENSTTCLQIATFNAGLVGSVPNYSARRPYIGQSLLNNNADFYCLQEYWLESDIAQLLQEVGGTYPHHFSPIHHGVDVLREAGDLSEDSPCTVDDVNFFNSNVSQCLLENGCMSHTSRAHSIQCMMQNCHHYLQSSALGPACITCLLLFVNAPQCYPSWPDRQNRLNGPGLLVISKHPLVNAIYSRFHSADTTVERGYLSTQISGYGNIVCAHLSSIYPMFFEYDVLDLGFTDYVTMQQAEIDHLTSTFGHTDHHILLGDFNTGPALPTTDVTAEYQDNYDRLTTNVFQNPYVDQVGLCSYCNANPLIPTGSHNYLIDHVLFPAGSSTVTGHSPRRIMDNMTCAVCPVSDHFGIEVTACF